MKTVAKLFRNKQIKAFVKRKKRCVLPNVSACPTVAVLINDGQLRFLDELKTTLNRCFVMKNYSVIVYSEKSALTSKSADIQTVSKKDFNIFGLVRQNVKKSLSASSYDFVLNLSDKSDEQCVDSYIMTLLNASFRISCSKSFNALYDMVIDANEKTLGEKIEAVNQYLLMLTGKKK